MWQQTCLSSHDLTADMRVSQTGDVAALDDFETRFKGTRFYKGMEMVFTNTKDGELALRIDGKEVRHWLWDIDLVSPCAVEALQASQWSKQVMPPVLTSLSLNLSIATWICACRLAKWHHRH